jgi:hypothetical protein
VAGGADAARWAGVEVARKAARTLYGSELGTDGGKVKIMIASLRIYEGAEGGWIPDVSELWGIPLITVFPNVRRAFDAVERNARPGAVKDTTPGDAMETMAKSTIFRQAWWLPGDGDDFCPDPVLTLETEDDDAVLAWAPVRQTFDQFIDFYRQMGEAVSARIALVRGNRSSND